MVYKSADHSLLKIQTCCVLEKKKSLAFVCEKAEAPQVYLKVIQKMV